MLESLVFRIVMVTGDHHLLTPISHLAPSYYSSWRKDHACFTLMLSNDNRLLSERRNVCQALASILPCYYSRMLSVRAFGRKLSDLVLGVILTFWYLKNLKPFTRTLLITRYSWTLDLRPKLLIFVARMPATGMNRSITSFCNVVTVAFVNLYDISVISQI